MIVAGSVAAGVMAAALLVIAPLAPAEEHSLTGMVLLGCALGWALLAVLSIRFGDQPQRWASAPAVFMAVVGVAALFGSAAVQLPADTGEHPDHEHEQGGRPGPAEQVLHLRRTAE